MKTLRLTLIGLIVTASSVLHAPASLATVTVDSVELVDRVRVGRTVFRYEYRVTATNALPVAVNDAVAYLTLLPASPDEPREPLFGGTVQHGGGVQGTSLVDDAVTLGTIPAGSTITSTDTYIIEQDRRFALDPERLLWEVGFTADVKLEGIVTDTVIPFAQLELIVDRSESGRPIIESGRPIIETYQATADDQGRYSATVDFVAETDFVTIMANGVAQFDFVALRSIAGSAGSLLQRATDGPLQVTSDDANALNVTHVSTALAQLAIVENGGQGFTNDEDLAAAQALVDTDELITVAAVLKTVIDNANVGLPPGVNSTQELLDNPDVFEAFLVVLQEDFPDELQAAIEETIIDVSTGYEAADLPDILYLTIARQLPFFNGANVFTFSQDENGSGTHIGSSGETTDATWVVNAAGEIIVTLNNPPEIESFPLLEVPPGSGNFEQVRELNSTTELRIVRIAVGIVTDQVLLGSTTLKTYPDHVGILPDVVTVNEPSTEFGYLAFDTDGIDPIVGADLPGESIALTYFHTDNNNQLGFPPEVGADLLVFGPNGVGSTARRGFGFTWAIDADGRLIVTFENGDRNEFVRYGQSDEGLVNLGLVVARYANDKVTARDVQGISMTSGAQFDVASLVNRKYRQLSTILDPEFFGDFFDFNFLPGFVGCRAFFTTADFDWQLNAENYVQILRSSGSTDRIRSWQAIAVIPGLLGDRYWVIENYDFSFFDGFPNDPTVTPGRISVYENIRDISGNSPPTANDDQASTAAGTPVFIPIFDNDTDPDGDNVLILGWSGTTFGGTVVETYDENFSRITGLMYTPPAGVGSVTDTFTYSIGDDSCGIAAAPATVSIDIGEAATVEYSWTGFMEPPFPGGPNPWGLMGDGGASVINDDGTPYSISITVGEDALDIATSFGGEAWFTAVSTTLTIGGEVATMSNAQLRFEDNVFGSDRVLVRGEDVTLAGFTDPYLFTLLLIDENTFSLSSDPAADSLPIFPSTQTSEQSVIFGDDTLVTSLLGTPLLVQQSGGSDDVAPVPITQGSTSKTYRDLRDLGSQAVPHGHAHVLPHEISRPPQNR